MTPSHSDEFLRLVRRHVEPVLLGAGFVLNEVVVDAGPVTAPLMGYVGRGRRLARLLRRSRAGTASAATTTSVLYEADAQEFAAAYPGSVERPEGADCKDLWLHFHESTGSVAVDLQGPGSAAQRGAAGSRGCAVSPPLTTWSASRCCGCWRS